MEDVSKPVPKRCFWVKENDPLSMDYHDNEWGRPVHDDGKLFEMLVLETFQAGLSWRCILKKRPALRRALDGFDPEKIKDYGEDTIAKLLADAAIIRNRKKIEAAIQNARVFLAIQAEWQTFDRYIWHFTDGKTVREPCDRRTSSPLSDAVSKDLKKQGMKFTGSIIIYSYLQAVGILNGHTEECAFGFIQ